MESVGAISEGEWSSFSGMYSNEESEFMMQFLNNNISWPDHELAMNMAGVDENLMFSSGNSDTNICHFSLENTSYRDGRSNFFPAANHESYYYASDSNQLLAANDGSLLDYCIGEALNQEMGSGSIEESCVNLPKADKNMQFETDAQFREPEPSKEVELRYPMQKSKKRCFNSGDVQNKKRNVKSRKNQKLISTSKHDEENDSAISEDDSNGGVTSTSEDPNGAEVVNENGKTRSNRKGPATDPQSLYARKRRERINERLRTLQNLVPNGTKVDISTMLEEAVQYVKFLQLQIKLLSSDDQWMYAPLAYNGMDLGLNLNVSLQ